MWVVKGLYWQAAEYVGRKIGSEGCGGGCVLACIAVKHSVGNGGQWVFVLLGLCHRGDPGNEVGGQQRALHCSQGP